MAISPGAALLPMHVHHEQGLVRRWLPFELLARAVGGVGLVEPEAGHILAQDVVSGAVVGEPLLVIEGAAGGIDCGVVGRVRVFGPGAARPEQREDDAVGILAGARPDAERKPAGVGRRALAAAQERRV